MEQIKILVTGSTGFIGTNLVKALVNETGNRYKVFCGVRETSDRSGLEKFNVNFRHLDLDDFSTFQSAIEDMNVVVHLAAKFDFHAKKEDLIKFNVDATLELAKVCLQERVNHFVYCSSTEAVGVVQDATEDTEYNPDDNYGLSKQLAEQELLKLQNQQDLPLTIARPSGVYGPGDEYVFTEIIQSLHLGVVKAIPGSGDSTIHFTYISDIVQGFMKIIQQPNTSIGEIYHIASDHPQTYNQIMETICQELDKKPPRFHVPPFLAKISMPVLSLYYNLKGIDLFPLRANAVQKMISSRSYSNKKIKEQLNFRSEVEFETGVSKTVDWLKNNGLFD